MCEKRERKGERIFLHIACFLMILILGAGCAATLNSQKKQGDRRLETADRLLIAGDYAGALKEYESAAEIFHGDMPGDRALFQMGLVLAHPDNPGRDYVSSLDCFRRLIRDFPKSDLMEEAGVWAGVINEILSRDARITGLEAALNSQKTEGVALKETYETAEEKNRILEDTIKALKKQINSLKQTVLENEEKGKRLEETVSALKDQLNALKEIDLGIESRMR
ncbi:MAG: hypothetical protein JW944_03440 [Deltaproteobacteria bacterium]|nr:hypothetical protein [Deltaproteobacteria bacterium]